MSTIKTSERYINAGLLVKIIYAIPGEIPQQQVLVAAQAQ